MLRQAVNERSACTLISNARTIKLPSPPPKERTAHSQSDTIPCITDPRTKRIISEVAAVRRKSKSHSWHSPFDLAPAAQEEESSLMSDWCSGVTPQTFPDTKPRKHHRNTITNYIAKKQHEANIREIQASVTARRNSTMPTLARSSIKMIAGAGNENSQSLKKYGSQLSRVAGRHTYLVGNKKKVLKFCMLSGRGGASKPNQDSALVMLKDAARSLFAVCDGHGPLGHRAAAITVQQLASGFVQTDDPSVDRIILEVPVALLQVPHHERAADPGRRMLVIRPTSASGYAEWNNLLRGARSDPRIAAHLKKLSQVEIGPDGLRAVNVGDSRALFLSRAVDSDSGAELGSYSSRDVVRGPAAELIRGCKWVQLGCEELSWDHNAQNTREQARMRALGVEPDEHGRIWNLARTLGWNFTQSLGDASGKTGSGLCCEPDVKELGWDELAAGGYIVIASDGLWEFVTNEEVVESVEQGGTLEAMCLRLFHDSRSLWLKDGNGHIDDITIGIIEIIA